MPTCLQCGKCCLGLEWTFNFKAEDEDPESPSEEIMKKAVERMQSYGLYYSKFRSAEYNEGYLSMTFKVGVCQYLEHDGNKASCLNHENRPAACRNYHCEKAKNND